MGKGIVKLGEGNWAVKDGNLLAAKETNGRFKNTEFTVTRGTDATYVDRDGLIKQFSTPLTNLVQNGDFEELGDELVTNGGFDTSIAIDSAGSGWKRIINGDNTVEYGGGGVVLTRGSYSSTNECKLYAQTPTASSNILTVGKFYKLTYTVVNNTNVTLLRYYIGGSYQDVPHSVGTHTHYFKQASNQLSIFWNQTTSSSITLDNVSVKEVGQNWTLGAGWSIGDGVATSTTSGSSSYLTQSGILTSSNTYQITFTVSNYVSGTVKATVSGQEGSSITANGTYTEYLTTTGTDFSIKSQGGTFNGKIDNVSVKDITPIDDKPRIDFTDNTDGHLLLEPQSTNLLPYSENFEGGSWTNESIGTTPTLEGGYTAPDGSNSAYKISNANQDSFWYYPSVADSDDSRTIWARTVSGTGTAQLTSHNSNTNNTFNLTETWQRFEVNSTTSSTGQTSFYAVDFRGSGTLTELLLWGAQLEDLPYATSYIPTNGSTVTRDAETCTGAGEAADFNSSEGVLYAEIAKVQDNPDNYRLISLNNAASNSDATSVALGFDNDDDDLYIRIKSGGVEILKSFNQSVATNNFHKIAIRYKSGDSAFFVNGTKLTSYDTGDGTATFTFPVTLDNLSFDYNGNGTLPFYGKCKALKVYKEALSDTDLQNLTS